MDSIGILALPGSNPIGVHSAFGRMDQASRITCDVSQLEKCNALILPGVGHFGIASRFLADSGLADFIKQRKADGIPILGICLGFHLMCESSEESPGSPGLGLVPAEVVRLTAGGGAQIPNMGWRNIYFCGKQFDETITEGTAMYFSHSYEVIASFDQNTVAKANYGKREGIAAVKLGNLWGAQFHPEKSHEAGLKFLESFTRCAF